MATSLRSLVPLLAGVVLMAAEGDPDPTFGTVRPDTTHTGAALADLAPGGDERALCGAVQSDGKILVGGWATIAGNTDLTLFRLNIDGSLDTGFGSGGSVIQAIGSGTDQAWALALQTDGKIVLAGLASNGSDGDLVVLRYTTTGVLDATFGTNGIYRHADAAVSSIGRSLLIQGDGSLLVGGQIGSDSAIIRLTSTGVLDTTFGVMGEMRWAGDSAPFTDLKTDTQGRVAAVVTKDTPRLVRLNASGFLDGAFAPILPYLYNANYDRVLIPLAADRWLIGGSYNGYYGTVSVASNGIVTPGFGTGSYLVAQPDGKLWGSFTSQSSRYLANGATDDALSPVNGGVGYATNPGVGYYQYNLASLYGPVDANRTLLDAPRKRILTIGRASGYYVGLNYFSDYAQAVGAIIYDVPPVATITRLGSVGSSGGNAIIRQQIAFNEAVTGLDLTDLTVDNSGSVANLQPVATNDRTWTVDVTVPVNGATTTLTLAAAGVTDSLGNPNPAASLATMLMAGTPVLSITPNGIVSNQASLSFTFSFNADVTGFDATDLTITGGTPGTFTTIDGHTFTQVVTPNGGPLTITVPASAATANGYGSTAAFTTVTSDRVGSTPTITLVGGGTQSNAITVPVQITFNEPVTGLALGDLTVTNGSAANLTGSGASYMVDITPVAEGNVSVTLGSGTVIDQAGNANGSAVLTFTCDRTAPTVNLTAPASGLITTTAPDVSWSFNEYLTRYPQQADLVLNNATISNQYLYSSGGYFTLTVIDQSQSFGFTIPSTAMKDAAGNAVPAITRTWTIPTPAQARAKEGVPDPTFGALMPNGLRTGGVAVHVPANDQSATCAAVQADGAVVMAGYAQIASNYDLTVARVTAAGDLDSTFGNQGLVIQSIGSGYDKAYDVAIQADGKIVVVGVASNQSYETATDGVVLRYTAAGQLDLTFGTNGIYRWASGDARAVLIQGSGRIVVAGRQGNRAVLLGLTATGAIDTTFGQGGQVLGATSYPFVTLAADSQGRLVMADGNYSRSVLRTDANGQVDAGFAPVVSAFTWNGSTQVLRANDGWLFSSQYPYGSSAGPSPVIDAQGTILSTSLGDRPYEVAQPDGRLWGGYYSTLFRSLPDGSLDDSVMGGSSAGQIPTPQVGWAGASVPQVTMSITRLAMDAPRGRLLTIGYTGGYYLGATYVSGYAMAVGATVIDADPTAVLAPVGSVGASGGNAILRFRVTFSEPVTGFDLTDLAIDNGGTLGNLQPAGSRSYTVDATVPSNGATTTLGLLTASVTDSTGHSNPAASVTTSVAGGTPVLAITPNGITTGAGSITATFTFSLPVSGFDLSDITIAGASAGTFTAVDTQNFTLILFPTGGSISLTVPAGAAQAGGVASTAASATIISDRAPPTADLSLVRGGTFAGGTAVPVRLSFNEPVTGLGLGSITVSNGTTANLQGSGAIYTFDVLPTLDGDVTVTLVSSAASDAAGNTSGGAELFFTCDRTAPTVTISAPGSGAVASPIASVNLGYGVSLAQYPGAGDVVLTNATLAGSQSFGSYSSYFSIQAIDATQSFGFSIPSNRFRDQAGNPTTVSVSRTWTVLTQPVLTVGASGLNAQQLAFSLQLAFDRPVSGVEITDLVAPGLTIGTPTGGPQVWTFPATAAADGTYTVSLPAAAVSPTNTNGSWDVVVATQAPVLTLNGVPSQGTYVSGPVAVSWQITAATGALAETDLVLTNAQVTDFVEDGTYGSFTVAPADPALPFGVTFPADIWTGTSGLTNSALTRQWTQDAIPPQVAFSPAGSSVLPQATTVTFTITPTESLFVGTVPLLADQLELSCFGGTITSTALALDGHLTVVVTPTTGRGRISLGVTGHSLLGGTVVDRAGTGLIASEVQVVLDDGATPTLVAQDPPASVASSELVAVRLHFSEDLENGPAVTGTLIDLISVTGASLASAQWDGPDLRIQLGALTAETVTVSVTAGAGQDLTGNPTPAANGTWILDHTPPVVTGDLAGSGQQFVLTIHASEPLQVAPGTTPWTQLEVKGGLLGVVTDVDSQTWTAPVWAMPNAGTVAVVVRSASITDLSGNHVALVNQALAQATVTATSGGGASGPGIGTQTSGPAVAASTPVPALIPYQGRLTIDGVAATGSVQLKFALVDGQGVQRWSHDGSASGEPATALTVTATDGLVATYLGDTATGQTALTPGVFSAPDLRLRIWVGQSGGFSQVAPDLRLGASGYALMSALVGPDGVDSAAIHNGAITVQDVAPVSVP